MVAELYDVQVITPSRSSTDNCQSTSIVPSSLGVDQFQFENAFDMTENSAELELDEVDKYLTKVFPRSTLKTVKDGTDVVRFWLSN